MADRADKGEHGGPAEVSAGGRGILQRCGQVGGQVGRPGRPLAGRGLHTGKWRAGRTRGRTGDGIARGRTDAVGKGRPRVCARAADCAHNISKNLVSRGPLAYQSASVEHGRRFRWANVALWLIRFNRICLAGLSGCWSTLSSRVLMRGIVFAAQQLPDLITLRAPLQPFSSPPSGSPYVGDADGGDERIIY